jgi:threonine aldolase
MKGPVHESPSTPAIDLRSDVLSPPTEAMFEAMRCVTIGLASRSEDQTVSRLEEYGAAIVGMDEAIFLPNATTANLVALLTQSSRGSGVMLDGASHLITLEWFGLTALCGLLPRPVSLIPGHLDLDQITAVVGKSGDRRGPRISVVCLENSHNFGGGVVFDPEATAAVADLAHGYGAAVHLDGARIFNASVALGLPPARLTRGADTVSLSLAKGLRAPMGGLLAGPSATIQRAREIAHQIGVTRLHKAGYIAAAALVALETMIPGLADDHRRAHELARALASLPGVSVELETVETNIVMADLDPGLGNAQTFADRLRTRDVGVMALPGQRIRLVTHGGIDDARLASAIERITEEASR